MYLRSAQGSRNVPLSWALVIALVNRCTQSLFHKPAKGKKCGEDARIELYVDDPAVCTRGNKAKRIATKRWTIAENKELPRRTWSFTVCKGRPGSCLGSCLTVLRSVGATPCGRTPPGQNRLAYGPVMRPPHQKRALNGCHGSTPCPSRVHIRDIFKAC